MVTGAGQGGNGNGNGDASGNGNEGVGDVPFTVPTSKMQNIVRLVMLLEDTGIRK